MIKVTTANAAQDQQELLAVRAKRFDDAIHLRRPDTVPIVVPFANLLSELAGCTKRELYDDFGRAQAALERAALALQPDRHRLRIRQVTPSEGVQ